MDTRNFGRLGSISAFTLGGGGIGGVWGTTQHTEAVETVRMAVDAGITMLDLAPTYGTEHEAELVAGDALRGRSDSHLMITTKVELPDDVPGDLADRMTMSLRGSMARLGRSHIDLFILHSQLRPSDDSLAAPRTLGWQRYHDEIVPTFMRLRNQGLIGAWGISGVGYPSAVADALQIEPRPDAVQIVVNALDLTGDMWIFGPAGEPANDELLQIARAASVPVVGIRAVAAGALTDQLDRAVDPGNPAAADFNRAAGFRRLAADLGESAASLAHRYALSVPGVATVVLGVKNRRELAECLEAESRGPLTEQEFKDVINVRQTAAAHWLQ
jgi:aryl-alcohol dehydrogenase-like predicted oxidoreductase